MNEIFHSKTEDDYVYVGPGKTNNEIDLALTELYDNLLKYKDAIFNVTEKLSPNFEDQLRLAINIAETDGELLKKLVIKDCNKKRELKKVEKKKSMPEDTDSKLVPINVVQHHIIDLPMQDASEMG